MAKQGLPMEVSGWESLGLKLGGGSDLTTLLEEARRPYPHNGEGYDDSMLNTLSRLQEQVGASPL